MGSSEASKVITFPAVEELGAVGLMRGTETLKSRDEGTTLALKEVTAIFLSLESRGFHFRDGIGFIY